MPITLTDDEAYAMFLVLDTEARRSLGTDKTTVHLRELLLPAYRDWHAANPYRAHPPFSIG